MKTTGLNFREAVSAAKDGKKVRRVGYAGGAAISSPNTMMLYWQDGEKVRLELDDYLAGDWEIVLEPLKLMGFMEAWEQAKQGKKIARLAWHEASSAVMYDVIEACLIYDNKHSYATLHILQSHIDATDWVVVGDKAD